PAPLTLPSLHDALPIFSTLLLMVSHRAHHQGQVVRLHPLLEHVVDEQRAGLAVILPGHHVADVMEVARDAGELGHTALEPQPAQDRKSTRLNSSHGSSS